MELVLLFYLLFEHWIFLDTGSHFRVRCSRRHRSTRVQLACQRDNFNA